LSRKDLIELEGVVARVLGYGTVEVECENNVVVRGILCGRMKKRKIKVIQGDRVQVRVSPYDPSHGIITWRLR
jgi:translation initiation factor IF-1